MWRKLLFMIKISIIVPVYNTEKYLRRCVDSLLHQTLQEVEIILVDDASTDGSKQIMVEYEIKYPRLVKCIYLKYNLCQGGARNRGLGIANGRYVTFVDSDDSIEATMCEELYWKAEQTGSDIVFCDFNKIKGDSEKRIWFSQTFKQYMGEITTDKRKALFMAEHYVAGKIIKRSLFIENKICFPEHVKYEDYAVMPIIMAYVRRIEQIRKPLYNYYEHSFSSSNIKNNSAHFDFLKAGLFISNEMKKNNFYKKYKHEIDCMELRSYYKTIGMAFLKFDNVDLHKVYSIAKEARRRFFVLLESDQLIIHDINDLLGLYILKNSGISINEFVEAYRSGVFNENNIHYFEKREPQIEKMLEKLNQEKKSVAIWGAGKKGIDFLKTYDNREKKIIYAIDKKKCSWGKFLDTGQKIVSFEEASNQLDHVIVMNKFYYNGILSEIKSLNEQIQVNNIDLFNDSKGLLVESVIE